MAPASSCISLATPRSARGIVAATGRLYYSYPLLFMALAVIVMAPYELAVLAVTGYGPLRHGHESVGTYWVLVLLRTSLITPLISALHMHAVATIGDGDRPRFRSVALRGVQVLPVVAAVEVMSWIGITLGYVALVIPGIALSLAWAVVAQAAALEGGGWTSALRSSRRLTRGHYWHVAGLIVLAGVVSTGILYGVRRIPLGSSTGAPSVVIGIAIDTVIASFAALTLALLYFDLRARQDAPTSWTHHSPNESTLQALRRRNRGASQE
jgi:hypothetical protein